LILDGKEKLGALLVLSDLDQKFRFVGVKVYRTGRGLRHCISRVAKNFGVSEECDDIYSVLFNPHLPYLLPEFLVYGWSMERLLFYNAPEWLKGWIVEDAWRRDGAALRKLREGLPVTPVDSLLTS
jgi:hypothetical protein